MTTYSVDLPKRTFSSHVGVNATRELFDEDRDRQLGSLNKSGLLVWRAPDRDAPKKTKMVHLTRRQFMAMQTAQYIRNNQKRKQRNDHTKPAV